MLFQTLRAAMMILILMPAYAFAAVFTMLFFTQDARVLMLLRRRFADAMMLAAQYAFPSVTLRLPLAVTRFRLRREFFITPDATGMSSR